MPARPRFDVLVVGSFVQDLTWRCAGFPVPGQTVVGTFVTGPGGKGSNQAVAAGRAGARTCYVGAIGADAFGSGAKAFYKAEKITGRWAVKPKHATGTAGILVNDEGQNQIIVALGANAYLARADVPPALIASARLVVAQNESNLGTTAYVLRTARKAGVPTVLNPAPMRPDFDPGVLRHVDILIPNETEFAELLRARDPKSAPSEEALSTLSGADLHALARSLGVPTVIITLGGRGCLVSTADGHTALAAHKVHAIDTTGAGDAFVGGFAAGWVRSAGDLVAAARYGNAVAALSVTKFGTAPAMPRQIEVERFLRKVS